MARLVAVQTRVSAIMRLAPPFRAEPLPSNQVHYWAKPRFPATWFRLPFDSATETVLYPPSKEPR